MNGTTADRADKPATPHQTEVCERDAGYGDTTSRWLRVIRLDVNTMLLILSH